MSAYLISDKVTSKIITLMILRFFFCWNEKDETICAEHVDIGKLRLVT